MVIATSFDYLNAKPVSLCKLSKTWGDESWENPANYEVHSLNLKPKTFTISGFSSGGIMTANLFTMFNDNIDGAGIHSGTGPCANAGWSCPLGKKRSYSTKGMKGKPVFFYGGMNDTTVFPILTQMTSAWFRIKGAKVKTEWINEFEHIFPNSVPQHGKYNPPLSCSIRNEEAGSAVQSCGYNMA